MAAAGGPAPSLPLAQGPTDADSVKAPSLELLAAMNQLFDPV